MHQTSKYFIAADVPARFWCHRLTARSIPNSAPAPWKGRRRCRAVRVLSQYDKYGRRQQEAWGIPPQKSQEAKEKIFKPTTLLPIVLGLGVASTLGPLVLALVAGAAGLGVAAIAGVTAMTVLLPVALAVGGSVAFFSIVGSIVGSIFSLLGFVPMAAGGYVLYRYLSRSASEAPVRISSGEQGVKVDGIEAQERRRQQEDLELYKQQRQEMDDFDRRLRNK